MSKPKDVAPKAISKGAPTKAYIINNRTNQKFVFQYNPEKITYARGANYSSIESPGMSYPLTQYTGGKVREFSFSLFMYDNPCSGKISQARAFLYKLLPPEYNRKSFTKPTTFAFVYGYFKRTYVLTNLEICDDLMDGNGKPVMSTFTLTVRQVGDKV